MAVCHDRDPMMALLELVGQSLITVSVLARRGATGFFYDTLHSKETSTRANLILFLFTTTQSRFFVSKHHLSPQVASAASVLGGASVDVVVVVVDSIYLVTPSFLEVLF